MMRMVVCMLFALSERTTLASPQKKLIAISGPQLVLDVLKTFNVCISTQFLLMAHTIKNTLVLLQQCEALSYYTLRYDLVQYSIYVPRGLLQ